jgi:maltooligosyltrehalose trehalohydrolase
MSNVDTSAPGAARASAGASPWRLTLGATPDGDGVRFRVWAPTTQRVEVVVERDGAEQAYPMQKQDAGYHGGAIPGLGAGTRYRFRLDGASYPDPASRSQPEGVNGPSEVVDPDAFAWTDDAWRAPSSDALVIYELHVGTFTREGTFDAAIERLDHVATLGANAIEVMPIASFSGTRGWGYDGVALYAPHATYGGPDGFKRLVDAAHARGLAVILDVVYNHFGPEGNYLPAITGGHFFTDRHKTPWGAGINYDGPESRQVRDYVLQNAQYWVHEYHVDGLRLDATHAILDDSPKHLLRELADALHGAGAAHVLIAEDERNERRVLLPPDDGGHGLDAVWADDFHHQVRRLAAGDKEGYFASYTGTIADLVTTMRKGWFYEGQVFALTGERRGTKAEGLPPRAFVHHIQNHDQVGNRAMGDRLNAVVSPATYRAASALLLASPYTPMLWMGQEWAATSPFQYFTDHPPELGKLVTEGRREEFKHFPAFSDPEVREKIPDPQSERTFRDSQLKWEEAEREPHRGMLALYRALLALRRDEPALRTTDRASWQVDAAGDRALVLRRSPKNASGDVLLVVVSLGDRLALDLDAQPATRAPDGARWSLALATEERRFGGEDTTRLTSDGAGRLEMTAPGAVVLRAVT